MGLKGFSRKKETSLSFQFCLTEGPEKAQKKPKFHRGFNPKKSRVEAARGAAPVGN
jgi:hypothetical protein